MDSEQSTTTTTSSQSLSGSQDSPLYQTHTARLVPFPTHQIEDSHVSRSVDINKNRSPLLFSFSPFPKYSVNIVTGPTSVGKTYFVTQIVNNYKEYFDHRLDRVFVILCNSRVKSISFDENLDVPVEQVVLSDFLSDHLRDNDLVIIDDLQFITPEVKLAISVCAHHQSLASLFVVTHTLLGTKNFELLSLCHRVFLFLGSTANHRLTTYILDRFFGDPITKTYLKTVLNFCANENEVLGLELSPIGHTPQIISAFSHLKYLTSGKQEAKEGRYCFLYPSPHFGERFRSRFSDPSQSPVILKSNKAESMSVAFVHSDSTRNLPPNTLIALPAQFLADQIKTDGGGQPSGACADRAEWETMLEDVEDNIESFFPLKRWKVSKNLAKEILGNRNFCITKDGKSFHLVDKPNTKVNLLSFLGLVTRRAGPNEKMKKPEWAIYNPHIRELLEGGTPRELFINTLLLRKSTDKGKRQRSNKNVVDH